MFENFSNRKGRGDTVILLTAYLIKETISARHSSYVCKELSIEMKRLKRWITCHTEPHRKEGKSRSLPLALFHCSHCSWGASSHVGSFSRHSYCRTDRCTEFHRCSDSECTDARRPLSGRPPLGAWGLLVLYDPSTASQLPCALQDGRFSVLPIFTSST